MERLTRQYGEVDVLVRMPTEEAKGERGEGNGILVFPEEYRGVYYGVYTSRDIAEWGMGGWKDTRVIKDRNRRYI